MIRAQLAAIRAQLDALEQAWMALSGEGEKNEQPAACVHPMDRRERQDTMGVERWRCLDCGHVHERATTGG